MPRGQYKRKNGKRHLSPAAINRIKKAQKLRWAKFHADQKAGVAKVAEYVHATKIPALSQRDRIIMALAKANFGSSAIAKVLHEIES